MKHVVLGVFTGGAAAAVCFGSAMAHADTGSTENNSSPWLPTYSSDAATLVQVPGAQSLTWDVPTVFHNDANSLSGTDYLSSSAGGYNSEFVTDNGAVYDQDQLSSGVTNLYYDSGASGAAPVDILQTSFGDFNISSMASLFTPADPSDFIDSTTALEDVDMSGALDLAPGSSNSTDATWTPTYGYVTEVSPTTGGSPVWEVNDTSFTSSAGYTLTDGTDYLTPSPGGYDNEFVTNGGAVFDADQLSPGVTNLYYDVGTGSTPVDVLQTSFGDFDVSWMASMLAPTDYADAVAVTPEADLTSLDLSSLLDLGLPAS